MKGFISGRWAPYVLSILRIAAAILFMQHGSQKLFAVPSTGSTETADLLSIEGAAGVLEFFGGILLLIGLWTRATAFILSGMMAYAYFFYHAGRNLSTLINRGELAVLYSFLFLYLSAAGGGAWSADALLRKKRTTPGTGSP